MTDLHDLTATETVRRTTAREIGALEVVDALLARIARYEPELQVWAHLDADGARARARELDAAPPAGPLHAVPLGVKDIIDVAGLPTRAGSRWLRREPAKDATVVERLRAAGAIVLGKTHTTEFAYADPAPTRNPWNTAHTPGGSSSGSAAGVAARMMPVALGTQTAGSVLRPAAFCGVIGLKGTYGRVSRAGVLPLAWSLDHTGLFARSVEDAALLLGVLAGEDGRDPTSAAETVPDYNAALSGSRPPRIGLVGDVYPERLTAPSRDLLARTATRLEGAGATLAELSLPPEFAAARDTHHVVMSAEVATVHAPHLPKHAAEYGPLLRTMAESGALVPATAYLKAQAIRRVVRETVMPLFTRADVLLVPSAAGEAPRGYEFTGDPSFNAPWSLLGLPCITVPAGVGPGGLPLGVQFVAAPWEEERLLAAAAWCERALDPAPAPIPASRTE